MFYVLTLLATAFTAATIAIMAGFSPPEWFAGTSILVNAGVFALFAIAAWGNGGEGE